MRHGNYWRETKYGEIHIADASLPPKFISIFKNIFPKIRIPLFFAVLNKYFYSLTIRNYIFSKNLLQEGLKIGISLSSSAEKYFFSFLEKTSSHLRHKMGGLVSFSTNKFYWNIQDIRRNSHFMLQQKTKL